MATNQTEAQEPDENSSTGQDNGVVGLTIGELARRTGISAPTLRMWETRHGFPQARRLSSGHRRYDAGTVDLVRQVVRRRDAGVRLETAVAEITDGPEVPAPSVFADLRSRHPSLAPYRLRKSTLLALTWALEDECCARAQQPWLFGAFQEQKFYRQAERRWRDLARTARRAWVLADFDEDRDAPAPAPVEVAVPESAAMRREWSLVCVAPDFPAVLAAWELPGQNRLRDGDRLFESVWSLEPDVVRDAARCVARVVGDLGHPVDEVLHDLDRSLTTGPGDLRNATTLFNRVVAYVDQAR